MLPEQFVYLAAILSILATISYLNATLKGQTKPNKVTWFFWALAPLIAFWAQLNEGVGIQSLLTFTVGFGPLLIFAASFLNKKAFWKLTKFDILCGLFACIGLLFWYFTKDGNIAIGFSIFADSMAALPTIVKTYKAPETEDFRAYVITGISALITIFTIDEWNFSNYSFPLYVLLLNVVVVSIIIWRTSKRLSR